MKSWAGALKLLSLVGMVKDNKKNWKDLCCRSSGVLEIIFYAKIFENEFLRGLPGSSGVRDYYSSIRWVKTHFFHFWPKLEASGISAKSAKNWLFSQKCVSWKCVFSTLRCAFLELLLKLKHFCKKLRTLLKQAENECMSWIVRSKERKNLLNP